MSNVRMIFSADLQAAADTALKQICFDRDIRIVVIATYAAINERWRRAISLTDDVSSISVVQGSAKEKEKAICSGAQIVFTPPGSVGRILIHKEVKWDVLIVDDLEGLISTRKEFKNNISAIADNTNQLIGITCSLSEKHLRYIPEVFRIIGLNKKKELSMGGFYERYYFKTYLKKDKLTICRLEPKPGAVEAVKRALKGICEFQEIDQLEIEEEAVLRREEYIPLDYREKSRHGFMKWIQEKKVYENCIRYNDEQSVCERIF